MRLALKRLPNRGHGPCKVEFLSVFLTPCEGVGEVTRSVASPAITLPVSSTANVDDGDIVRVDPPPARGMVEMQCWC
jgi:hypothetical protein